MLSDERMHAEASKCVHCCTGRMEYIGNMVLTSEPVQYVHRCNKCGWKENFYSVLTGLTCFSDAGSEFLPPAPVFEWKPLAEIAGELKPDSTFLLGLADGARRSGRKDVAERLESIAGRLPPSSDPTRGFMSQ